MAMEPTILLESAGNEYNENNMVPLFIVLSVNDGVDSIRV